MCSRVPWSLGVPSWVWEKQIPRGLRPLVMTTKGPSSVGHCKMWSLLVGCADCARFGYGLLQQENDRDAEEACEGEIAEVVYIRPEARLLVYNAIDYS